MFRRKKKRGRRRNEVARRRKKERRGRDKLYYPSFKMLSKWSCDSRI